jgi:hypothetical protein
VLHIKTNLGSTMAATCSGLRGVVLAVSGKNVWPQWDGGFFFRFSWWIS